MSSEIISLKSTMKRHGYFDANEICNTLQGCIWLSKHPESKQHVVIKSTNKTLHSQGMVVMDGKQYHVHENILKERAFLKYLTTQEDSPKSIVKYIDFFQDNDMYYLVMENGGSKLFDFIINVHECINQGTLAISEWHQLARLLFKQMVNAVDYMHSRAVAHFDVSLENMLISDIDINIDRDKQFTFVKDDPLQPIQVKLCDLGLSEFFESDNDTSNKYCGKCGYKSPEIIAHKQRFSAYANDIWCLGVTLFMMILGGSPWKLAEVDDENFKLICIDGDIMTIAKEWNRIEYVTEDLIDLLSRIFKYEDQRISMTDLKKHPWLN